MLSSIELDVMSGFLTAAVVGVIVWYVNARSINEFKKIAVSLYEKQKNMEKDLSSLTYSFETQTAVPDEAKAENIDIKTNESKIVDIKPSVASAKQQDNNEIAALLKLMINKLDNLNPALVQSTPVAVAPYDSTIQITEIISEMATYEGMTFDEELEGVRSFVASKLGDKDFEPPKEEDTEEEKDNEKESVEEDERPVNQKVVMKEKV